MKLKTLKDLQPDIYSVDKVLLKAEAVKWVKQEIFCDLCEDDFKRFFNITEVELVE